MARTYYDILNVLKDAPADEIKSSYRKLSIKYHPDKNPGDIQAAEKFMEISKAYETLYDPEKRKQYDLVLTSPKPETKAAFTFTRQTGKAQFDLASALHLFMQNIRSDQNFHESLFDTKKQFDPQKGSNLQIHVALTLNEILTGCKKTIKVKHTKKCKACNGYGGNKTLAICTQCAGKGKVRVIGQSGTTQCNMCFGTGKIPAEPCSSCSGSGRVPGQTKISVKFPPGIAEGNYLTMNGMGEAGIRNGLPGDLLIFIDEESNNVFTRTGYDLETETAIFLSTAVLGGTASIINLEGDPQSFRIKPGTQSETIFCIKQKGLPFYKQKGRGNLYIRVHVKVPSDLTDEQEKYFKKFISLYEKLDSEKLYRKIGLYYLIDLDPNEQVTSYRNSFHTAEILTESKVPIGLNFKDIEVIDSIGLGYIIKVNQLMMDYKETLMAVNVSTSLMDIFKDTCIDALLKFVKDESELKKSVYSPSENESTHAVREVNGHHLVYAGNTQCSPTILEDHNALELLNKSGNSVGIELRDIETVDSKILGCWLRYFRQAKSNGAEFFLLSPSDNVHSVLQTTNLDKLLKIVDSEKEL